MHLKIVYVLGVSHNLLLLCAANWQEELHKYISPDQLPQAYGGTRCEPDPWCTDYVSACYTLMLYWTPVSLSPLSPPTLKHDSLF